MKQLGRNMKVTLFATMIACEEKIKVSQTVVELELKWKTLKKKRKKVWYLSRNRPHAQKMSKQARPFYLVMSEVLVFSIIVIFRVFSFSTATTTFIYSVKFSSATHKR